MPKRTYINLINDFWDRYAREPISAPASMVYFYLLNLINRNRWKPVFISNSELADAAGISRRGLPSYKAELAEAGLLCIEDQGEGRTAGTTYRLPGETEQNCAVKLRKNAQLNRAKKRSLSGETAQKGTVNRANLRSLTPSTPYNIYDKTYIRPSTTTEDTRAGARNAADVEVEEVEILEDKDNAGVAGAADLLEKKKERAAAQGAEILKSFFAPSNQGTLEKLCMGSGITPGQLRGIAESIVAQWIQVGRTHDDLKGNFDISEGITHLQWTIPKKAAAEARREAAPKSREQSRRDLINHAMQGLRDAIANDGRPAEEEEPPF